MTKKSEDRLISSCQSHEQMKPRHTTLTHLWKYFLKETQKLSCKILSPKKNCISNLSNLHMQSSKPNKKNIRKKNKIKYSMKLPGYYMESDGVYDRNNEVIDVSVYFSAQELNSKTCGPLPLSACIILSLSLFLFFPFVLYIYIYIYIY